MSNTMESLKQISSRFLEERINTTLQNSQGSMELISSLSSSPTFQFPTDGLGNCWETIQKWYSQNTKNDSKV